MGFEGTTSAGIGSVAKPAIKAATKTAQAAKVKAVSVKIKIKKKFSKEK